MFTEWSVDGAPLRIAVVLRPGFPIHDSCCLELTDEGYVPGDPGALPGQAQAALGELQEKAVGVMITKERIELSLAAPLLGTRPIVDGLHRLEHLATLLRSKAGPYR